ncbi:hypothetical protein F5878DRAFT_521235, partial [Lentinula raphanica]
QQRYVTFSMHLLELLKIAERSLEIAGQRSPALPRWLEGNVGNEFLIANDFEVLCIAYRFQVEQFLWKLNLVHNFTTGQPHGADK